MISQLPRALVARYAPAALKRFMHRTWRQVQQLRGRAVAPQLLFTFGGRTQYAPGMGRQLYAHEPAFRETIQACERISTEILNGPSVIHQFAAESVAEVITDERQLVHLNTVLQLALVDFWRAQGVQPNAVLGISLGEIAAVYAAGGLSLTDALRVSNCYGTISQVEEQSYCTLVVSAGFTTLSELIATCPVELFIVLVADATTCFTLCLKANLPTVRSYLAAHGLVCHRPATQQLWPYHTARLSQHLVALRAPLEDLQPQPLTHPCYLTLAGGLVPTGTVLGIDYWLALAQYPVNFHHAIRAVIGDGYQLLTPIGAYPFPFFFSHSQQSALGTARLLPFLRNDVPERETIEAIRQELTLLRLLGPQRQAVPPMSLQAFVDQLDLASPAITANPHPAYTFLRQHGNLHFLPREQSWLVVQMETINEVIRQPQLYSSAINARFDPELVGADAPLHTHNRALFQPFFSPKALAPLSEFTSDVICRLAAPLAKRAAFDFVADLALPITQAVTGEVLGLSDIEQTELRACLTEPVYGLAYVEELTRFFASLLRRRTAPAVPIRVIDQMLEQIQQGQLSVESAAGLLKVMWAASTITTSMLLSTTAHYFLVRPDVAARLRAQPSLTDAFIEEVLRLEPPELLIWRTTTQATTLAGQVLPAGCSLSLSLAAANRDPARFANPDALDLDRPAGRQLAFGGGIHACLGAHLSRLEARALVKWLLHTPTLRSASPAVVPVYFPSAHFRGLAALALTLQPVASPDV